MASFLGVAGAAAVLLFAHAAYGELAESALEFGRGLAEGLPSAAGPHRVSLNGQRLFVAAHTTSRSVTQVLEEAGHACRSASFIALRRRSATGGMVACVTSQSSGAAGRWGDRIRRFGETRDLADLGLLQYTYARESSEGRVHVVRAWTSGPFRLDRLFDSQPKSLPPGVPAVPDTQQLLRAEIDRAPHVLLVFAAAGAPAAALARYDSAVRAAGWHELVPARNPLRAARAYVRDGAELVVLGAQGRQQGMLVVIFSRRS